MFKLIRLSLNGKCEGQSFSYSFADGINYFKGKNDSGKTEFYTFLDYMLGANINLADKDWFRDSLISAELMFLYRIRFLDNIELSAFSDQLYIVFHANIGKGKQVLHDPEGYHPWATWEYIDPFHREHCFLPVILDGFTDTTNFRAKYYSEEEFYACLKRLNRNY